MQRQKATYNIAPGQYDNIKQGMLNWAKQFSILLFLDSNHYRDAHSCYECLLAAGVAAQAGSSLAEVNTLHQQHNDWLFGHICYDHKNAFEPKLVSNHPQKIAWPELYFFCPEVVCYVDTLKTQLTIESLTIPPGDIHTAIVNTIVTAGAPLPQVQFTQRISRQSYLDTVIALRQHIANGDCYEINFCNEGYCYNAEIEPLATYNTLTKLSPAPFAAYYRNADKYMMCASPERYICKQGDKLLSQPIKGTARRDADPQKDKEMKTVLQHSIKDRAENVMIVDLVRNDLARCCETGSVQVDELFGIYSFPQVHQMISTVSGKLKAGASFADALQHSFPMGSMTGAPKIKVMELIDEYETSRRELFSGTVGYITPGGDFDFNVIIRSLFYNVTTKYLAYQTGGAITYDSSPEQEWEEMRLKAWALERLFNQGNTN